MLGVRFVSVRDQTDTSSPLGRAMFAIIDAMAELEASLISEVEALATSTNLSIRAIRKKIANRASRGIAGEIIKRARGIEAQSFVTNFTRMPNSTFCVSGCVAEGVREPLQQGSGDFNGLYA